jgi:hypothetical protein
LTTITLHVIQLREYYSRRADSCINLVPESPGVYIWSLDPHSILSSPHDPSDANQSPTTLGHYTSRSSNYYDVDITVKIPPPNIHSLQPLEPLYSQYPASFRNLLCTFAALARPLYVGRARDLRQRFHQHTHQDSLFRDRLYTHTIDITQVAFTYVLLPTQFLPSPAALADPEIAFAAEDQPEYPYTNNQNMASQQTHHVHQSPDHTEALDATLMALEHLLLRLTYPTFNERLD